MNRTGSNGTGNERKSLYVTIDEVKGDEERGSGLIVRLSTQEREPQRGGNPDRTYLSPTDYHAENYDGEIEINSKDPNFLVVVFEEIRKANPDYRIVPKINITDIEHREQFFVAYQTKTGRNLKDFLQA